MPEVIERNDIEDLEECAREGCEPQVGHWFLKLGGIKWRQR